jgi:nucleoside-triphosphatase
MSQSLIHIITIQTFIIDINIKIFLGLLEITLTMDTKFKYQPHKNILITGRPRVGKTTLIKQCAEILGKKAGGFYTEEIRGKGVRGRKGFQLITLAGVKAVLAEVDFASEYKVGRYGVHLDVMEKIAVPAILDSIQHKDWILIDEIGKMEEGSLSFRNAVIQALDSSKRVLANIRWNDNEFTRRIKSRDDVTLIKLIVPTREEVHQMLNEYLQR